MFKSEKWPESIYARVGTEDSHREGLVKSQQVLQWIERIVTSIAPLYRVPRVIGSKRYT